MLKDGKIDVNSANEEGDTPLSVRFLDNTMVQNRKKKQKKQPSNHSQSHELGSE